MSIRFYLLLGVSFSLLGCGDQQVEEMRLSFEENQFDFESIAAIGDQWDHIDFTLKNGEIVFNYIDLIYSSSSTFYPDCSNRLSYEEVLIAREKHSGCKIKIHGVDNIKCCAILLHDLGYRSEQIIAVSGMLADLDIKRIEPNSGIDQLILYPNNHEEYCYLYVSSPGRFTPSASRLIQLNENWFISKDRISHRPAWH